MTVAVAVRERPILFSGPMVRAILDGRKTMTRRVVKPQYEHGAFPCPYSSTGWAVAELSKSCPVPGCTCREIKNPYGQPGDRLWVRESFALVNPKAGCELNARPEFDGVRFKATWDKAHASGWKPSIHMPRWASRLTLEITEVRVERLQAISEEDAIAEGVTPALLLDMLEPFASRTEVERLHWLTNPDNGERFCKACATKAMKPGQAVDGGWGTEEDGSQICEGCDVLLDCAFTDYGAEQELKHFEEHGLESANDAWCVRNAIEGRVDDREIAPQIARPGFRYLWDSLNKSRGYGWDVNPFVWVIAFRRSLNGDPK